MTTGIKEEGNGVNYCENVKSDFGEAGEKAKENIYPNNTNLQSIGNKVITPPKMINRVSGKQSYWFWPNP